MCIIIDKCSLQSIIFTFSLNIIQSILSSPTTNNLYTIYSFGNLLLLKGERKLISIKDVDLNNSIILDE